MEGRILGVEAEIHNGVRTSEGVSLDGIPSTGIVVYEIEGISGDAGISARRPGVVHELAGLVWTLK